MAYLLSVHAKLWFWQFRTSDLSEPTCTSQLPIPEAPYIAIIVNYLIDEEICACTVGKRCNNVTCIKSVHLEVLQFGINCTGRTVHFYYYISRQGKLETL